MKNRLVNIFYGPSLTYDFYDLLGSLYEQQSSNYLYINRALSIKERYTRIENGFIKRIEPENIKFYHSIEKNHDLIKALTQSKQSIILKCLEMDLYHTNIIYVDKLFNNNLSGKYFFYVHDLEHYILSIIMNSREYSDNGLIINDRDILKKVFDTVYAKLNVLVNTYNSNDWDYVIRIDELTGDISKDCSLWFDESFLKDLSCKKHVVYNKESLLSQVKNYDKFLDYYKDFIYERKVPVLFPVSRSDFVL